MFRPHRPAVHNYVQRPGTLLYLVLFSIENSFWAVNLQLTVYRGSSIPARPPWHTAFAPMMKVIQFNIGCKPLDVDGVFHSAHIEMNCTIIINL